MWEYLHKYPIAHLPLNNCGTVIAPHEASHWVMHALAAGIHRDPLWEILDELRVSLELVCTE